MIRIVIAEDQALLLGAIASLLDLEEDMDVVGLAKNGEEAVRLVNLVKPDVCIMDMEMPRKTGIEAAEELKHLQCKVIILTTFARNGYYKRVIEADISGYLLKDSPGEELAGSIRSIMSGSRIYTPELMDQEDIPEAPPPLTAMKSVKTYFSTLKDKIKMPAG
ncbi:response regulator transcription factor [Rossellomorea aquimaris]|uniref:response regulator n=1 Tax=Rossellomorea aquimaris TaxID=189382 RepID=UPI001CD6C11A|nr:response regulator transcription factor [Rossellomorea aquimaris]MCA1055722.1 response regulator transcription factor [Rossellomorea aquimaris]